jgi:hypothetical protein
MHLGIFIDGPLHPKEQAFFFQRRDMGAQIWVSWIFHFLLGTA